MKNKPMLNAYPDSMGGRLADIVSMLKREEMKNVFGSFYILPSIYHSDLDRGFSVIDYDIMFFKKPEMLKNKHFRLFLFLVCF